MKLQKHLWEEVQITQGLMNHMRKCGLHPDSSGKLLKFYRREICSLERPLGSHEEDDWMGGGSPEAVTKCQGA